MHSEITTGADTRPLLYDVFCGGGGCSKGYQMAGFRVIGIDVKCCKTYPGDGFLQMGWQEFMAGYMRGEYGEAAAFHASPECQGYCALSHFATKPHNMEIPQVRAALQATGKPYVIENVERARSVMRDPLLLCGSMFGLQTDCGAQLRRHRLFEIGIGARRARIVPDGPQQLGLFDDPDELLIRSPGPCRHGDVHISVQGHEATNEKVRMQARKRTSGRTISVIGSQARDPQAERERYRPRTIGIYGHSKDSRTISVAGACAEARGAAANANIKPQTITVTGSTPQQNVVRIIQRETFSIKEAQTAMGISWLSMRWLSQAIPPAFAKWIGRQIMAWVLEGRH